MKQDVLFLGNTVATKAGTGKVVRMDYLPLYGPIGFNVTSVLWSRVTDCIIHLDNGQRCYGKDVYCKVDELSETQTAPMRA